MYRAVAAVMLTGLSPGARAQPRPQPVPVAASLEACEKRLKAVASELPRNDAEPNAVHIEVRPASDYAADRAQITRVVTPWGEGLCSDCGYPDTVEHRQGNGLAVELNTKAVTKKRLRFFRHVLDECIALAKDR
jgi:hypothetical protein